MKKISHILRLHFESKLSQHQIAKSLQLSSGVVNKYVKLAVAKNLSWPLPEEYADEKLLKKILCSAPISEDEKKADINFSIVHQELKRKGMTLQLLWEEYCQTLKTSVSYSHYCLRYREWRNSQPTSMRQTHKAGDKIFVDYAGPTVEVIDTTTGEIRTAQIFVGILGASNYTFVEATWTQKLPDWIGSHRRMFEFFGGVPALIVPDNLRSAVTKTCRYEPIINATYAEFIAHYGTAVLPARPYKPKDKAKVENAVLIVERWILARLRHQQFFNLATLNNIIKDHLRALNERPFKKLPGTRLSAFESIDKPALRPLPVYPYEFSYFANARVNIDYHIEIDRHYYSVPYQLIHKTIEVRYTQTMVICWFEGKQIAAHSRSILQGKHSTLTEHMPKSHQKYLEWTPGRFLNWAANIGRNTVLLVKYLLENKPHPEQGFRSCMGLLSFEKKFTKERLEQACEYAIAHGTKSRKSVESILKHKLDKQPLLPAESTTSTLPLDHENVRGETYYH